MKTTNGDSKKHTRAESRVMDCKCVHGYQDNRNGIGKRLHNAAAGPNNTLKYRCTVCGSEK